MEQESRTVKWLKELFADAGTPCIELIGKCQKCSKEVSVVIFEREWDVEGNGGVIKGEADTPEFKCYECLEKDGGRISPTRCEVFSRVVGYLRPVQGFNPGKKAEFKQRTNYDIKEESNGGV